MQLVEILTQSLESTLAPASSSSLTMTRWPQRAANASGVHPSASAVVASAPEVSSNRTESMRPLSHAHMSAVVPFCGMQSDYLKLNWQDITVHVQRLDTSSMIGYIIGFKRKIRPFNIFGQPPRLQKICPSCEQLPIETH